MGLLDAWLQPEWPAPAHVRAVFTTRDGGVSEGCWAGLNLGDHVGDVPEHVGHNRDRLAQALGYRPQYLAQVHGTEVVQLPLPMPQPSPQADAAWTGQPGQVCTVMVADCLPVLFTDTRGRRVAAAHAGWRGLLGHQGLGVLETTVQHLMAPDFKSNDPHVGAEWSLSATDLIAWLGPCIGPQAFEVGHEVRAAFVQDDPQAQQWFRPGLPGKWWADLPGLARHRLTRLGLTQIHGNDGSPAWCTVSQPSRFFSHRRDAGTLGSSGRMAACIWIDHG